MKPNKIVLLLSEEDSHLVHHKNGLFHTRFGTINLSKLQKLKFGDSISTHIGKKYFVVEPTILDILQKMKRTAQVILPKDVALILAFTGLRPDWVVTDAGFGSGYTGIFLANFLSNGKVVGYENRKEFYEIAKQNIKFSGLKNIIVKRKDVSKGIEEKNINLITLDLQNAKAVIKHVYKSLRFGGWLVVYSPTIEHLISIVKEIKKKGFSQIKTVENIVREWQIERTTRPKTIGLMHTGWLTFARKL